MNKMLFYGQVLGMKHNERKYQNIIKKLIQTVNPIDANLTNEEVEFLEKKIGYKRD